MYFCNAFLRIKANYYIYKYTSKYKSFNFLQKGAEQAK